MCEYCGNGFNNKPFYMDEHSTIQLDDDNNLDIDYEEMNKQILYLLRKQKMI